MPKFVGGEEHEERGAGREAGYDEKILGVLERNTTLRGHYEIGGAHVMGDNVQIVAGPRVQAAATLGDDAASTAAAIALGIPLAVAAGYGVAKAGQAVFSGPSKPWLYKLNPSYWFKTDREKRYIKTANDAGYQNQQDNIDLAAAEQAYKATEAVRQKESRLSQIDQGLKGGMKAAPAPTAVAQASTPTPNTPEVSGENMSSPGQNPALDKKILKTLTRNNIPVAANSTITSDQLAKAGQIVGQIIGDPDKAHVWFSDFIERQQINVSTPTGAGSFSHGKRMVIPDAPQDVSMRTSSTGGSPWEKGLSDPTMMSTVDPTMMPTTGPRRRSNVRGWGSSPWEKGLVDPTTMTTIATSVDPTTGARRRSNVRGWGSSPWEKGLAYSTVASTAMSTIDATTGSRRPRSRVRGWGSSPWEKGLIDPTTMTSIAATVDPTTGARRTTNVRGVFVGGPTQTTGQTIWSDLLGANIPPDELKQLAHDLYFNRDAPTGDGVAANNLLASKLGVTPVVSYQSFKTDPGRSVLTKLGTDYQNKAAWSAASPDTQGYLNKVAQRIWWFQNTYKKTATSGEARIHTTVVGIDTQQQAGLAALNQVLSTHATKIASVAQAKGAAAKKQWNAADVDGITINLLNGMKNDNGGKPPSTSDALLARNAVRFWALQTGHTIVGAHLMGTFIGGPGVVVGLSLGNILKDVGVAVTAPIWAPAYGAYWVGKKTVQGVKAIGHKIFGGGGGSNPDAQRRSMLAQAAQRQAAAAQRILAAEQKQDASLQAQQQAQDLADAQANAAAAEAAASAAEDVAAQTQATQGMSADQTAALADLGINAVSGDDGNYFDSPQGNLNPLQNNDEYYVNGKWVASPQGKLNKLHHKNEYYANGKWFTSPQGSLNVLNNNTSSMGGRKLPHGGSWAIIGYLPPAMVGKAAIVAASNTPAGKRLRIGADVVRAARYNPAVRAHVNTIMGAAKAGNKKALHQARTIKAGAIADTQRKNAVRTNAAVHHVQAVMAWKKVMKKALAVGGPPTGRFSKWNVTPAIQIGADSPTKPIPVPMGPGGYPKIKGVPPDVIIAISAASNTFGIPPEVSASVVQAANSGDKRAQKDLKDAAKVYVAAQKGDPSAQRQMKAVAADMKSGYAPAAQKAAVLAAAVGTTKGMANYNRRQDIAHANSTNARTLTIPSNPPYEIPMPASYFELISFGGLPEIAKKDFSPISFGVGV